MFGQPYNLFMGIESDIKIELVTSKELYNCAMSVRRNVFVKEQGIAEDKEFDGNDFCAAHVVAYIQRKYKKFPVGTMRIRFFSDFAKFERMAVIPRFRKTDVSENIMQFGFNYVSEKGYRTVYGMCKKELLTRWKKCGYSNISGAESIEQNDMELIPIKKTLSKNSKALTLKSNPKLLTLKEGSWSDR